MSSAGRLFISRNVVFCETEFPFTTGFTTPSSSPQISFGVLMPPKSLLTQPFIPPVSSHPTVVPPNLLVPISSPTHPMAVNATPTLPSSPTHGNPTTSDSQNSFHSENTQSLNPQPSKNSTSSSTPTTLNQPSDPPAVLPTYSMVTRGKVDIFKPKA